MADTRLDTQRVAQHGPLLPQHESRSGLEVRLVRLSRHYGDVTAVRDVDLTVAPGEFLTLLGPSGSGKTTTLMMIAGFVEPSSGDILIGGRSVVDLPPERRNIGVVFQNYALFPHMSVFDNVAFPLRMRRVRREIVRQQVLEALELVQLGGMAERRIQQLSGGQQQRVALARALVFRPPLLLMDEPLGALDRKLREQMQIEIKRIQKTLGLTVIYVTHDQEEALSMSDRVAIMNQGVIHQVGSPIEIYERPATTFVAQFIGESNLLDGIVEGSDPYGITIALPSIGVSVRASRCSAEPGQVVHVLIRPEAIDIYAGMEATLGDENRVSGQVLEVVYAGQSIRYLVDVGGCQILVRRPHRPNQPIIPQGTGVTLTWAPSATLVIVR